MQHEILTLIETRFSANLFDASQGVSDQEIETMVSYAIRAPTAYNLQNWRFVAVRSPDAKVRLRAAAHDQPKVTDAAVAFIIIGILPDPDAVVTRLAPAVDAAIMSRDMAERWRDGARTLYADPAIARDEAVRSATFGAATLMFAASALGFASGPMVGFDAAGVRRDFDLADDELPVMLLAVGRAAPGNWPQKPRRLLGDVLEWV
ncbi:nitroreductase family protein [Brevundimonas fontaquae]|uniref:Nitroreductase family protein n=1 Tax=Brevundimonas fontaquae TaxID=2813778 RepID=A0ABX7LRY4_9CAUL|nr:nitroreductase family protein [Brevundimonas fontaquae]QSF54805.1 nitroreductase family protein [Brevundimonas fontaquae]